jgi:hypothetical protein
MTQQRRDPLPKVYSLHAPEVECIGKGKAHKPYEFGCKVTVATTNARSPKSDGRSDRNFLHGKDGDRINAILTGAGRNFRLILAWLARLLAWIWAQALMAFEPFAMGKSLKSYA